jgi:hypothetical protein
MFTVVPGILKDSLLFKLLVGHGPEPPQKRITKDGLARARNPISALA